MTMPQKRTVSSSGLSPQNQDSNFWDDVEREGASLLHCISPLRMSAARVHRKKRRCRTRTCESIHRPLKSVANTPTLFRDHPEPVGGIRDLVSTGQTRGTPRCSKRNRRRSRSRNRNRRCAAEKESGISDKYVESDGEESGSALSGKLSEHEESLLEQTKTVIAYEADPHRTVSGTRQPGNSGMLVDARLEPSTSQTKRQKCALDRRKTLEVSENHNTGRGKHRYRESIQRHRPVSQLATQTSSHPEPAAKSTGFPRTGALIARFEAKGVERCILTPRKRSRIVVDPTQTVEKETGFGRCFPRTNSTTSTATSSLRSSTTDPHVTPTPARYGSVRERIADFTARRQKRILERQVSCTKSTEYRGSNDSTTPVDCCVSAGKLGETRISEPNCREPLPILEQQPAFEQHSAFNAPKFCQGVKACIAVFEERQQGKRLQNGTDLSACSGPDISTDCSRHITPDASRHAAPSTVADPDYLDALALTKIESNGDRCATDKSGINLNESRQRNATESDSKDSVSIASYSLPSAQSPHSLPSPLAQGNDREGGIASSSKLPRRTLMRRRRDSAGSVSESFTDTSAAPSLSSGDAAKKLTVLPSSCGEQTSQQLPPAHSSDCTRRTVPPDLFRSPLIRAVGALHAKPQKGKHHQRQSDTCVSSSEGEKRTDSDSVDGHSLDGRPAQRQLPTALPAAQTWPASELFGFSKFTANLPQRLEKRKETLERLFSSSEETDPDVASAKAASQEFLHEEPDIREAYSKGDSAGCISFEAQGSSIGGSELNVVNTDNASLEHNAEEIPSEEVPEEYRSCNKSNRSFWDAEQNWMTFRTRPQSGPISVRKAKNKKNLNKDNRTKQPETERQKSVMMAGTGKDEGLLVDLKRRLYKRHVRYKTLKQPEEISTNNDTGIPSSSRKPKHSKKTRKVGATGKHSSRSAHLTKSKDDPDVRRTSALLRVCDAIQAVQKEHATRIQDNRESCRRSVSPLPVEWEETLVPGMQQQTHRQYLLDRFFKLLLERARETRLSHRHPQKPPNKTKQLATSRKKSVRTIKAELKKDGWIDYETLPDIFTLQDPKRFIQKIKQRK